MTGNTCGHSISEIHERFVDGLHNLVLLGRGVDKVAYALPCGAHVLKIGGEGQMAREIDLYQAALGSALAKYLAPIECFGKTPRVWRENEGGIGYENWSVQVRVDMDCDREDDDRYAMTDGAGALGISDIHAGNYGWHPTLGWLMVDYGITFRLNLDSIPVTTPSSLTSDTWCINCDERHAKPCHDRSQCDTGVCPECQKRHPDYEPCPLRKPVQRRQPFPCGETARPAIRHFCDSYRHCACTL